MTASADRTSSVLAGERRGIAGAKADLTLASPRLERIAAEDPGSAQLVELLLGIAVDCLARMYDDGAFAFRLDGHRGAEGGWQVAAAGSSLRYTAIAALGLLRLPEQMQRRVLAGDSCRSLIGELGKRLDSMTSLGDVALACWAAAEARHADLPHALSRLAEVDRPGRPRSVVDAAWVVSALVAARSQADVEAHLSRARGQLVAARGAEAYPHAAGYPVPWYRSHVGSFADQVYPVQALARLHASSDDPQALAIAEAVTAVICAAQGEAGQWWWHYDSRSGSVVEGYPVYSVHQHAMAPMALMDLADAGGQDHLGAVLRGLQWLADPPETAEELYLSEPPITWRKVARNDYRKAVRGVRAASTRIRAGWRLQKLDRAFRPKVVDHECRPYELGWLLMTWLS